MDFRLKCRSFGLTYSIYSGGHNENQHSILFAYVDGTVLTVLNYTTILVYVFPDHTIAH
jgi:hypothetical protein